MTNQKLNSLVSLLLGLVFIAITVAIMFWPDMMLQQFRPSPHVIDKHAVPAPSKTPEATVEPTEPESPPYAGDSSIGVQSRLGDLNRERHAYASAARHYLRAAVCGDVHSQDELAKLYEQGRGVSKDYRKAWLWMRIAYELGRADESIEIRMKNYQNHIPLEMQGEIDDAFELWTIRRPDQSLTCQTIDQVAEPLFEQGLFRLD